MNLAVVDKRKKRLRPVGLQTTSNCCVIAYTSCLRIRTSCHNVQLYVRTNKRIPHATIVFLKTVCCRNRVGKIIRNTAADTNDNGRFRHAVGSFVYSHTKRFGLLKRRFLREPLATIQRVGHGRPSYRILRDINSIWRLHLQRCAGVDPGRSSSLSEDECFRGASISLSLFKSLKSIPSDVRRDGVPVDTTFYWNQRSGLRRERIQKNDVVSDNSASAPCVDTKCIDKTAQTRGDTKCDRARQTRNGVPLSWFWRRVAVTLSTGFTTKKNKENALGGKNRCIHQKKTRIEIEDCSETESSYVLEDEICSGCHAFVSPTHARTLEINEIDCTLTRLITWHRDVQNRASPSLHIARVDVIGFFVFVVNNSVAKRRTEARQMLNTDGGTNLTVNASPSIQIQQKPFVGTNHV